MATTITSSHTAGLFPIENCQRSGVPKNSDYTNGLDYLSTCRLYFSGHHAHKACVLSHIPRRTQVYLDMRDGYFEYLPL
ncbi:hypothetical protein TNCV_3637371 [Trichonephila clavipes]|nr:hypothetical protein TNCV_3637371 [Trichonephila clavipes]